MEEAVTCWDVFFVGDTKALLCIPEQKNPETKVNRASLRLSGRYLEMRRDDEHEVVIALSEAVAAKLADRKELVVAESQGKRVTASYTAAWEDWGKVS